MNTRPSLLDVLGAVKARLSQPLDVRDAIAKTPPAARPLPQVTWAAFALLHHHLRLLWGLKTVRTRLRTQMRRALENNEDHDYSGGLVPGLPDWSYSFEDWYCTLTHRGTGEELL